jgi:hypothetical protein
MKPSSGAAKNSGQRWSEPGLRGVLTLRPAQGSTQSALTAELIIEPEAEPSSKSPAIDTRRVCRG